MQSSSAGLGLADRSDEWMNFDETENDKDINRSTWLRTGDMQAIPWERVNIGRDAYRAERMQHVRNYFNILELGDEAQLNQYKQRLKGMESNISRDAMFFQFAKTWRSMQPQVLHFQLRNLVWSTSSTDIYYTQQHCVRHFNTATREVTKVMILEGNQPDILIGNRQLHKVQISTLCVKNGIVAAGGFSAELIVQRFDKLGYAHVGRITDNENGITNGIDVFDSGKRLVTANNDQVVRVFDTEAFKVSNELSFDWAVNFARVNPTHQNILAVVGDDPEAVLSDIRTQNPIARVPGHEDYSFAVDWHPNGTIFATGNQDFTARIWDIRKTEQCLRILPGTGGAIRSIRFSQDGRFMSMSEPVDFVHVYDVKENFNRCQNEELDFFGEITGISFSPDSERLFIGVQDQTYGGLIQLNRYHKDNHLELKNSCENLG
eukprot:TRINITY_DN17016_c0_g1_i1.p1 TRINITY_DN17016_c0_g1~~TRINITY_DN17016_c0_g1_i1.p1  ORF type:complete len:433 (-),score=51.56 TRINITY_DN17016_c0_g1_i1:202-1500(-)